MAKTEDPVITALRRNVEAKRHNPTFKFVVGSRAFTAQEILDNVEKGTPEGKKIREMILYAAADLILA